MSLDVMEQMRNEFRPEAMDLLIELDSALLALEAEPADSSLVHRVFRAIHTIKGSGATAGFTHLAKFAHKMEEAFDLAREGRLAVSPELIDCGLKACDVIRLILATDADDASIPGEAAVTGAFTGLLPAPESRTPKPAEKTKTAARARSAFEIVFKPNREMFYSGADPVTLLDDLRELGQAHVTAHADQVPPFASLEAEHCYLWWDILLVTDKDAAAVKEVFVYVEDACEVRIRLLDDQADSVALLGAVPVEAFELFVAECEDHLQAIERDALLLEQDSASKEDLDSLFRGVHSVKGNAGVLLGYFQDGTLVDNHPLRTLMRVAHALESQLEPFRGAATGPLPDETIQVALETCDAIRSLLGRLTHNGAGGPVSPELLKRLGVKIAEIVAKRPQDGGDAAFFNTTSQCVEMIAGCFQRLENDGEFTEPVLQTYLRGLKTLSAAAHYRKCAELEAPLAQQLHILDVAMRTGEVLDSQARSTLASGFRAARAALDGMSPNGNGGQVPEPTGGCDSRVKAPADRPGVFASPSTIRIEQNKLDRLMRVVGELLVARGAVPLLAQKLNDGIGGAAMVKELRDAGSNISRIADELQASVMSIRMLPVKTVFQKFPRLVRDLARSLGKEIQLVIEGEGIEMDKTILEQIGDPLVHLIRNSVDHGIELPEERRAQGKDGTGQLTLRAAHQAGGVVIEITDDGRGLDAGRLKRKAVEKGLLTPEASAAMSEEAAFQLVFLPGLSTAAKVTDVSGRGVGMDVVRSNVRNLQGTIEIRSKAGRGTTLLIKLPTSLMISKGILLEAGAQEYILPLSNIRDMVKVPAEAAHDYRGLTLAQVRGNIYSIFNLAEMLGLVPAKKEELSLAIVEAGSMRYGLVVDKFVSEVEVLIKPLAGGLEQCKEFQGAAIMGDGRVVLVLNALECHSLDRTACA